MCMCTAVCCSVLQCVAVCSRVLQCVAVRYIVIVYGKLSSELMFQNVYYGVATVKIGSIKL